MGRTRRSDIVFSLRPVRSIDLRCGYRCHRARGLFLEFGEHLARNPLEHRVLSLRWLVEDELVDAGLYVGADHVVEGLLGNPWIRLSRRHPEIQRAVEGV